MDEKLEKLESEFLESKSDNKSAAVEDESSEEESEYETDEEINQPSKNKNKNNQLANDPTQTVSQESTLAYGFENDTHTYTDPNDGTSYFWDRDKNAWFPKIDEDFMARYQMSYGFVDPTTSSADSKPKSPPKVVEKPKKLTKEEKKAENKRKLAEPATWFEVDDAHNTTIYISNLPLDVTMDELKQLVTKYGLLDRDDKGNDKLKLYTDSNGELKGDARCTYLKVESVALALDILDGYQLREKTLKVEKAKFELKGEYDPSKKPKRKKNSKENKKKKQEKLLDWRPDPIRGMKLPFEKVVIIKNVFDPEEFDKNVTLISEYSSDMQTECSKCGEVTKVKIYDRNPEGVVQVKFKEFEAAEACVELLNGRWFAQRRLTAEIWDGKTKYLFKETEEEALARINKWEKDLEEEEKKEQQQSEAK